jgi:hypothetical protein
MKKKTKKQTLLKEVAEKSDSVEVESSEEVLKSDDVAVAEAVTEIKDGTYICL